MKKDSTKFKFNYVLLVSKRREWALYEFCLALNESSYLIMTECPEDADQLISQFSHRSLSLDGKKII